MQNVSATYDIKVRNSSINVIIVLLEDNLSSMLS